MKKNSLVETTECTWNILEEEELSEKGNIVKPMKIAGVASRGNVVNGNNRHYSTSLFEREVGRVQGDISKGSFLGLLDHPDKGNGAKLKETAMKFTKLFMENDYMMFEADVLDTNAGKDLKALLRGKVQVQVSTRGYGSSKKEKINGQMVDNISDDYELTGIDAVSGHSNPEAEINYFKEKKEGGSEMKLTELREKYPDLIAEAEKAVEDRVKKEVTDDLTSKFEDKVLDEIGKTRSEMTKEITASITDELMPEYEENQAKLAEIADIVGDLIEKSDKKAPDEKDEKLKILKIQLEESNKKIDAIGAELKEAKAKIDQSGVKEYLDEALKNEPFKVVLKERLSVCLTKEEVDKQLPIEKDYVQKIVQEGQNPKGKGRVLDENQRDEDTKTKLDEDIKRQRRLAGLPEIPDKE